MASCKRMLDRMRFGIGNMFNRQNLRTINRTQRDDAGIHRLIVKRLI